MNNSGSLARLSGSSLVTLAYLVASLNLPPVSGVEWLLLFVAYCGAIVALQPFKRIGNGQG